MSQAPKVVEEFVSGISLPSSGLPVPSGELVRGMQPGEVEDELAGASGPYDVGESSRVDPCGTGSYVLCPQAAECSSGTRKWHPGAGTARGAFRGALDTCVGPLVISKQEEAGPVTGLRSAICC